MSPTTGCGCRVEYVHQEKPACDKCGQRPMQSIYDHFPSSRTIVYCPLHAAASEMLAALKADYAALPYLAAPSYELIHQRAALIERAEGKASDSKSTQRKSGDTRT